MKAELVEKIHEIIRGVKLVRDMIEQIDVSKLRGYLDLYVEEESNLLEELRIKINDTPPSDERIQMRWQFDKQCEEIRMIELASNFLDGVDGSLSEVEDGLEEAGDHLTRAMSVE